MLTHKNHSASRRPGRVLLSVLLFLVMTFSTLLPGVTALAVSADGAVSLTAYCRGTDGKSYKVTAAYTAEAAIPADASLSVKAVTSASVGY